MLPENRVPTHPGGILLRLFLNELPLSQSSFAELLQIPAQRVNEIVKGKRGITPDTAILFANALGTTPEFWMSLQAQHDLGKAMAERKARKAAPIVITEKTLKKIQSTSWRPMTAKVFSANPSPARAGAAKRGSFFTARETSGAFMSRATKRQHKAK